MSCCWLLLILVLLSVCAGAPTPSHRLDEDESRTFLRGWLLFDDPTSEGARRKGPTAKSVFIAPVVKDLPDCAQGYYADALGRCHKIVQINQAAQLGFLLQKLNAMYANNDKFTIKRPSTTEGPVQVPIPLQVKLATAEPPPVTEQVDMVVVAAEVQIKDERESISLPGAIVTLWHLNTTTDTGRKEEQTSTLAQEDATETTVSTTLQDSSTLDTTETKLQDGTTLTTDSQDGTTLTTNSELQDGTTLTTNSEPQDGITLSFDITGTTLTSDNSGTTSTINSSGTTLTTDISGTTLTTDISGTTLTRDTSGTTLTTDALDGTTTTLDQDSTLSEITSETTPMVTETSPTALPPTRATPTILQNPVVVDLSSANSAEPPLTFELPGSEQPVRWKDDGEEQGGSWSWGPWHRTSTTPRPPLYLNFWSSQPHVPDPTIRTRTGLRRPPSRYPATFNGRPAPLYYQELTGQDVATVFRNQNAWYHGQRQ